MRRVLLSMGQPHFKNWNFNENISSGKIHKLSILIKHAA